MAQASKLGHHLLRGAVASPSTLGRMARYLLRSPLRAIADDNFVDR